MSSRPEHGSDIHPAYVHSVKKWRSVAVREVPVIVLLIDANVGQSVDSMLCRGCPVSARIDNDAPVTVIGDNIGVMQVNGDSVVIVTFQYRIIADFDRVSAVQDSRSIVGTPSGPK